MQQTSHRSIDQECQQINTPTQRVVTDSFCNAHNWFAAHCTIDIVAEMVIEHATSRTGAALEVRRTESHRVHRLIRGRANGQAREPAVTRLFPIKQEARSFLERAKATCKGGGPIQPNRAFIHEEP